VIAFAIGAVAGFFGTLALLTRTPIGPLFKDAHPSVAGFGYFMMGLAEAAATAVTAALLFITLPWKRPLKDSGTIGRFVIAGLLSLLTFVILTGQGHAPAFVLAITIWIALVAYFTYVRHGILDSKPQ
jgi:hypothetical protein